MTKAYMKTNPTEENTSAATHAEKIALCLGPDTADAAVDRTTANALDAKATDACDPQMTKASMKTNPTEENTYSVPHVEEIADPLEPDVADPSLDRTANALEAKSVHVIDLRLPGGQFEKGINPLEGAKLWMKQYYPNLDSQCLSVNTDYDMPMPMLDKNTLANQISKKESENKDDGDAKYLKAMKICMTGIEHEITVTDMFKRFFKNTKPMIIISQFQFRNFSKLFDPESVMEQEIDDVIILGEYSTVILLEIKSSSSFSPSMAKSLYRKMKFRFYFCFNFLLEINFTLYFLCVSTFNYNIFKQNAY